MNKSDYELLQKYACGEASAEESKTVQLLCASNDEAKRILEEFSTLHQLLTEIPADNAPAGLNQNIMKEISKNSARKTGITGFFKVIFTTFITLIVSVIGYGIYESREMLTQNSQFSNDMNSFLTQAEETIALSISPDLLQVLASILAFITAVSLYLLIEKFRKTVHSTYS